MKKINKKSLLITIAIMTGMIALIGLIILFPIVGIVLYLMGMVMTLGVLVYLMVEIYKD
jgi:hypothetical protein